MIPSDRINKTISGFSHLSKQEKIDWLVQNYLDDPGVAETELKSYWHQSAEKQELFDAISENTVSNFTLPFGIAPNFVVNGEVYCVPMVIEESSVVAAASSAAKYWMDRGGFTSKVINTIKNGHIHLFWYGPKANLISFFDRNKEKLFLKIRPLVENMNNRGGGIVNIQVEDCTDKIDHYYQIAVEFETCDSMGANFINSVLETIATEIELLLSEDPELSEGSLEIIMSILSNYTPNCLVRASVECAVDKLSGPNGKDVTALADRFQKAVKIAQVDPSRAATHNKGIFNGVDAVLIATGNDFRAVEASCHSFASRDGSYKGLSNCSIENGQFRFWLDLPVAVGTVGGLTAIHPLARLSLEMLGNPNAEKLMQIIAAVGLAQNFAAIRSLVTTGIQKGHMKMHLRNILNNLKADPKSVAAAESHFADQLVSYSAVRNFLSRRSEK